MKRPVWRPFPHPLWLKAQARSASFGRQCYYTRGLTATCLGLGTQELLPLAPATPPQSTHSRGGDNSLQRAGRLAGGPACRAVVTVVLHGHSRAASRSVCVRHRERSMLSDSCRRCLRRAWAGLGDHDTSGNMPMAWWAWHSRQNEPAEGSWRSATKWEPHPTHRAAKALEVVARQQAAPPLAPLLAPC